MSQQGFRSQVDSSQQGFELIFESSGLRVSSQIESRRVGRAFSLESSRVKRAATGCDFNSYFESAGPLEMSWVGKIPSPESRWDKSPGQRDLN